MIKAILEYFKNKTLVFLSNTRNIGLFKKINFWLNFIQSFSKFKTKVLIRPTLKQEESHTIHKHYFNQDLWVAQQILAQNTKNIADVGSRIDGYIAHIACHQNIDFYDIVKPNLHIKNITEFDADLISGKGLPTQKYDGLSCLHVLEHLGLGRYDSIIDELAYKKGFTHLCNMLNPGGTLYISVPCSGTKRIEYNQHQVFTPTELLDWGNEEFTIKTLCCETDDGTFYSDISNISFVEKLKNCWYGLGIVVLQRK